MVLLLDLLWIGVLCKSLLMAIVCNTEAKHLVPSLEKETEEELAMVKLSDAAANPKAVVIELANAPVAVAAVA